MESFLQLTMKRLVAGGLVVAIWCLAAQAVEFSVEERIAARYGSPGLVFADDPALAAERYEIRTDAAGRVVIAGSTRRARIYGLGRHLRTAAFRGGSEPVQKLRGVYFATHFGNWYVTAPEEEVRAYVEDLALWGCNQVRVWFDLHGYSDVRDPAAKPLVERLRAILRAVRDCGLETSLIALSNESFATSPDALRADWRGGQNGYQRELRGHYHVEICPSKPGGLDLILRNRADSLGLFKDIGIDEVAFFSYDQGGCTCADCAPWGCNGMLKVLPGFSDLVRRTMPGCRIEYSTWYFDAFGSSLGEWNGLEKRMDEVKRFADALAVENLNRIAKGVPGGLRATTMPEISMGGMLPWGGFGANPQPRRFAGIFRNPGAAHLTGCRPYSEGIYEDINKVLVLALGWDPSQDVEKVLGDYAAFYFGKESRGPVVAAALLLEQNLDQGAYLVQDGRRWDTYSCNRIDVKRPYGIVVESKADKARAARALSLLKPFDVANRRSWRWRVLFLRAVIDDGLARGMAFDGQELAPAFAELANIYRVSESTEPFLTPPGPLLNPGRFRAGAL